MVLTVRFSSAEGVAYAAQFSDKKFSLTYCNYHYKMVILYRDMEVVFFAYTTKRQ